MGGKIGFFSSAKRGTISAQREQFVTDLVNNCIATGKKKW